MDTINDLRAVMWATHDEWLLWKVSYSAELDSMELNAEVVGVFF